MLVKRDSDDEHLRSPAAAIGHRRFSPGALNLGYLAPAILAGILGFAVIALPGLALKQELPFNDYLVFHLVAEFSGIVVSFAIFAIGWYGYKQRADARNLVIAMIFLAVGVIDFVHALSYDGMPDFLSPNSVDKAALYWIFARLVAAAGLLVVPFIPGRIKHEKALPYVTLVPTAAAVAALILLESHAPQIFPATFVPGEGLTRFKDFAEYLVIAMSASTIVVLWFRPVFGRQFSSKLQVGLLFIIFAELAFTFYASADDSYNMLGHIYKVLAYYFILRAIFVSALQLPYRELEQTRQRLNRSFRDIGNALSSSFELDQMLNLIVELAAGMLRSDFALLSLKEDGRDDMLPVRAHLGFADVPRDVPLENSLAARLIREREPVWSTPDFPAARYHFPDTGRGIPRSVVGAPIIKGDEVIGVLEVFSLAVGAFDEDDARDLTAFARHAAIAIENTGIFQDEREAHATALSYANQLSLLHKIGLALNIETDMVKLMDTILEGAAGLTSAGVGILTLISGNTVEVASTYNAPWSDQSCNIQGDLLSFHRRVSSMTRGKKGDVLRLNNAEGALDLPRGHMKLDNVLLATLKDTRGRVRGHFLMGNKPVAGGFSHEDEDIIALLAAQSSVALTSAENFARERSVAETLQDALLPEIPELLGLDIGLLYQSSDTRGRVGGDFYDLIRLESGETALVIGDVCGKGLDAATYTAMIKYMLEAYLGEGMSAGDCLTRLNRMTYDRISLDKFITVCICTIYKERETISIASAGHPPPIASDGDSAYPLDIPPALPLGVNRNQKYATVAIPKGNVTALVLFTDGLIESRPDDDEPFGESRLGEAVQANRSLPAQQLAREIVKAASDYADANLRDDIALLVAKFL